MGGDMANEGLSVRERLGNWRRGATLKEPRAGAPSYRLEEREVEGLLDEVAAAWRAHEVDRLRLIEMIEVRDSFATRLEAAADEVSRLERENRDHKVTIATLRGNIATLRTERVEMVQQINARDSQEAAHRESREKQHRAEVDRLKAEIARLSQATAAPNPGARTFAHENRRLREELESAQAALESLSKAGETLTETAARLSRENEALTSVNRDFREEVRLLTTERDMAKAALGAAEREAGDHHWKDCLPDDVPVIQNFHVYGPIQAKEGAEPGLARYCDFWSGPFVRRGGGIVLNARSTYATGGVVEGSAPLVAGSGACTYPAPVFPPVTVKREGPRFEKTEQVAASGRRGGKAKARNKAIAAWVAQWIESGNPRLVLEQGDGSITARVEWPT